MSVSEPIARGSSNQFRSFFQIGDAVYFRSHTRYDTLVAGVILAFAMLLLLLNRPLHESITACTFA